MSWKNVKLGGLIDVLSGYAFDSKHFTLDVGKPLIRIRDIKRSFTETYFNSDYDNKFLIKKGDVLIGMDGEFNISEWKGKDALLNQRVCKVSVKDTNQLDLRYLLHYLPFQLKLIEEKTSFVTVKHLSVKDIQNILIPLPPLETQKRIADILDAADTLRQKDQELLKKYDELAQAIFIEMFGDPVKNEKGWMVSKLGDCSGVGSSVRVFVEELVGDGIPFLRGQEIGALSTGELIEPSLYITKEHYNRLKSQGGVPKIGDLLLPSICPDGRIFQVVTEDPFYFKDGRVLWIKVNENHFNSTFLRFLLKEKFLRNYTNIASGTTFAELKIFALKDLELILPEMALQNKFAQLIKSTLVQLQILKEESKNSSSLFNSLIQKAFNGELVP